MHYTSKLTPSTPSEILIKIKKLIPTQLISLSSTEMFMMAEDDVMDDTVLVKVLNLCSEWNININDILFRTDRRFCLLPRYTQC